MAMPRIRDFRGVGGIMLESIQLSGSDVTALLRILSEVVALSGDTRLRKQVLADHTARLIGADRWVWVVSRYRAVGNEMMAISFLHRGYSEREVVMLMESTSDPSAATVEQSRMAALCREGRHFTRRRHELIPDQAWYASRQYDLYHRPMGLNEYLTSVRPMADGLLSGIEFHRNHDRPAFTEHHCLIVHALFSAGDTLHLMDLPDSGASDILDLPPRVRTTFGLLLEGFPRKKIAQHLGVSPNTVAEYASRVYRHFGVAGQRELMLRFRNGESHHHSV